MDVDRGGDARGHWGCSVLPAAATDNDPLSALQHGVNVKRAFLSAVPVPAGPGLWPVFPRVYCTQCGHDLAEDNAPARLRVYSD